ncbi:cleavage stimulation factor subunit 1 [Hyposmocoma kahamanoa]|uniref:cleavage stimulation factor subunit 1 n=1 Tax=Hyposmocoma kahamanoa TaxID=1477025 RepID=UPI000E6D702C|nr:cleavage stimulation factor subunit 1 [Hyposmocoma kahamanoa]
MKESNGDIDTRNVVKNRELLYRMIISQLYYDGFQPIAATLAAAVHADPPCPPSDRLLNVMMVGLQHEPDRKDRLAASSGAEHLLGTTGFDLEYEMDASSLAPEPATYETAYVTSHKMACRAGAFSACGQLVATGSVDASIKILDVERMLAKSAPEEVDPGREQQGHPVIRTLYDHTDEITALDFHPREQILVSASRDCCIKLFDITKASAKKAYKSITDAEQVLCVAFHPLGDHIIASTTQPVIRLYDVTTGQCFVCPIPSHHHTKQVNSIKFSPNGKYFASGSADGTVKLWDGVSNRCFNTLVNAHDGAPVCSVAFTRNSKYVLTSGLDSSIKLWELASSRCLIQYTGAGTTGKQEHHAQAIFNHTEDYVMFPDEATTSLCTWHSRNASRCQLMSLGHNGAVRFIVHSGTAPAFLTCSDDYRARFWYRRNTH